MHSLATSELEALVFFSADKYLYMNLNAYLDNHSELEATSHF